MQEEEENGQSVGLNLAGVYSRRRGYYPEESLEDDFEGSVSTPEEQVRSFLSRVRASHVCTPLLAMPPLLHNAFAVSLAAASPLIIVCRAVAGVR